MMNQEHHIKIAQAALNSFGGNYEIDGFVDNGTGHRMSLVRTLPDAGRDVSIASTVGLSDYPVGLPDDEKPVRIEIIGWVSNLHDSLSKMLAECSFLMMDESATVTDGTLLLNTIHHSESEMRHAFMVPQFSFDTLVPMDLPDRIVTWMLAIPISDSEQAYYHTNGPEALYDLFMKHDVKFEDLLRKSLV